MKTVDLCILFLDESKNEATFGVHFSGVMSRKALYLKQKSVISDTSEELMHIKVKRCDTTMQGTGPWRLMIIPDANRSVSDLIHQDSRIQVLTEAEMSKKIGTMAI